MKNIPKNDVLNFLGMSFKRPIYLIKNRVWDPMPDRNHIRVLWIEKVPAVFLNDRDPREYSNVPGKTHSETRKTNSQHFPGKLSHTSAA